MKSQYNKLVWAALALALPPALSSAASGRQLGIVQMTFDQPVSFVRGERLRLNLGGSASTVQVQMQSKGAKLAAVGGVLAVPASRTVELVLPDGKEDVSLLAVQGNGPASIVQVERIVP